MRDHDAGIWTVGNRLIALFVYCTMAPMVFLPLFQIVTWLRFGNWPVLTPKTLLAGLGVGTAVSSRAGVQAAVDLLANLYLPLAGLLLFSAAGMVVVGIYRAVLVLTASPAKLRAAQRQRLLDKSGLLP